MPQYRVRMEFEVEAEDREEAAEIVETYVYYGLKDFPLNYKMSGTEEIR